MDYYLSIRNFVIDNFKQEYCVLKANTRNDDWNYISPFITTFIGVSGVLYGLYSNIRLARELDAEKIRKRVEEIVALPEINNKCLYPPPSQVKLYDTEEESSSSDDEEDFVK